MTPSPLAERIVAELTRRGERVAVAESLTGGLLASAFVDVPGASAVFGGGVVAYSTVFKAHLLGVDQALLDERGAVDPEVARQMASGANRLQYDIYGSGGGTVWKQATNRVNSPGAADGQSTQPFPYTARIYTDQPTPPIGTYTDSVIVDVRY